MFLKRGNKPVNQSIYLSSTSVEIELHKGLSLNFVAPCSSCPLFRQEPGSSCPTRGNLVVVVCINASVFGIFTFIESMSFKMDLTLQMEQTH